MAETNTKKGIWITAAIAVVLLITSSLIFNSIYKNNQQKQLTEIENQKVSFTDMITSRDSIINEAMATFDEIEKELVAVKEKENLITLKSTDKEFSTNKKQQILNDIASINTLLDKNKKKIALLSNQLKEFGIEIKGLQDKIASLEISLKQSETEVVNLKDVVSKKEIEITQLNTKVSEQQNNIAQKEQVINNQTAELNKAFVIVGTVKELKLIDIITKEGGFMGIGKKQVLHFSEKTFNQVDVTEFKTITLTPTKNAKLVTNHPVGSYELRRDLDNKVIAIDIKDPSLFWKVSKYAVVEIK